MLVKRSTTFHDGCVSIIDNISIFFHFFSLDSRFHTRLCVSQRCGLTTDPAEHLCEAAVLYILMVFMELILIYHLSSCRVIIIVEHYDACKAIIPLHLEHLPRDPLVIKGAALQLLTLLVRHREQRR